MKLFVILLVLIATNLIAADSVNGAKLYNKCTSCHGKDGLGKSSQKAPMIAGQYDWYIVAQVTAIKSGKRSNKNAKKMVPFVSKLSASDISDLAAYISTLPVKSN